MRAHAVCAILCVVPHNFPRKQFPLELDRSLSSYVDVVRSNYAGDVPARSDFTGTAKLARLTKGRDFVAGVELSLSENPPSNLFQRKHVFVG